MHFVKSLRNQEQTRRYSIATTDGGWEVREERDSEVVQRARIATGTAWSARADRSAIELNALRDKGWREEN